MGFGPDFYGWVSLICANEEVKITLDGQLSDMLSLSQVYSKGNHCHHLLFSLVTEILTIAVQSNNEIKYIRLLVTSTQTMLLFGM